MELWRFFALFLYVLGDNDVTSRAQMAKYLNSDTTSHYLAPKNIPGVTIRINAVIQLSFGGFIAIVALFLGVYGNDDVTNRA